MPNQIAITTRYANPVVKYIENFKIDYTIFMNPMFSTLASAIGANHQLNNSMNNRISHFNFDA
jgi:hypothetical protein